jgi:putative restriction endonuclease
VYDDRLRSIVPLFGGGGAYVETLDDTLAYVDEYGPTTEDLVGWHRGHFSRVSSADSIMRRVRYLHAVGFLEQIDETWSLGRYGEEYYPECDRAVLTQIMLSRNVGLRSLLYALAPAPMTIDAISRQQLQTHPELGWAEENTDMASQRVNWLRSLGLVEPVETGFVLTDRGHEWVESGVVEWAGSDWRPTLEDGESDGFTAGTYETTTVARRVDPEFRATALSRYDTECPVSMVDHPGLLDVAHVCSWSDYPAYRADLSNVLVLSKTHHAAFDRNLFTVDSEYRLQVDPQFETQSDLLRRTLIDRDGDRLSELRGRVDEDRLTERNASVAWVSS